MGVDSVGSKPSTPVAPKPIEVPKPVVQAKPVEAAKPQSLGQKLEAGFDALKKKMVSISGRYTAQPLPKSAENADLKDLVAAQRSAINAGGIPKEGFGGGITIDQVEKSNAGESKKVDNPPNTEAAKVATGKLDDLKKSDKATADALATPGGKAVEKALVSGVETPRAQLEAGQAGVISPHQAERAAKAYGALSKDDKAKFDDLMGKAGKGANGQPARGADPQREQALMLKALGAGHTVDDVKKFAEGEGKGKPGIRGMNAEELTKQTTPYDLDGGGKDVGLYQQHGNSCAPTVAMMLEHENDPIKCREFELMSPADQAKAKATEQAKTLSTSDGMKPLSRDELIKNGERLTGFDDQMDKMRKSSSPLLNQDERAAMARYVNGVPADNNNTAALDSAKKKLAANKDSLSPPLNAQSELDAMRTCSQNSGMDSIKAYQKRADVTGTDPHQYKVDNTDAGKEKAIGQIQTDLQAGKAVPIGVSTENGGGHAMLAQQYDPKKGFLISDPMSGKTQWMTKDELKGGKFKEKFGIDQDRLSSVTVDKPAERKELGKLYDDNGTVTAKPQELLDAVKKNPGLLDHMTKDERSAYDSAVRSKDEADAKPAVDTLKTAIASGDDEAVRGIVNHDPALLKYLTTDEKAAAFKKVYQGYTSNGDAHAMKHIIDSCESKNEIDNLLAKVEDGKVTVETYKKYDKVMASENVHPYLIADKMNPDNPLPRMKVTPNTPEAVKHYKKSDVEGWRTRED